MARWGKLNFAQKQCVSKAGLLMQRTSMLSPGARIGIAFSGGVDSFTMLQVLWIRQAIIPFPVEIMALHINPGFTPGNHAPLARWTAARGIASHFEDQDFGPRAFTEENRKNSVCFFCSMLRRKRLFDLCRQYRLTHLALGHTADDLVTTFFMNVSQNGRVDGMKSKDSYFGGELTLIRPLLLCEKSIVRRAARAWNLPVAANPCPQSEAGKRKEVFDWLQQRWKDAPGTRKNFYNAICKWQFEQDSTPE